LPIRMILADICLSFWQTRVKCIRILIVNEAEFDVFLEINKYERLLANGTE